MRAAADLVLGTELLPGPAPLPDFASLVARRSTRRRIGIGLGTLGAFGALAGAAALLLWDRAPISYVVDGAVAIADGVIDAAGPAVGGQGDGTSARVHFSEGTEIDLTPGARLRVVGRTEQGAALALDHGRARFAVTHRLGARWSVTTGPFTVDVVGTRFALEWSPRDERLVVELVSGVVHVRGASVGGPVAMHPGERLIATAADRRVTLSPLVEEAAAPSSVDAGHASGLTAPTAAAPNVSGSRLGEDQAWSSRASGGAKRPGRRSSHKLALAAPSRDSTRASSPNPAVLLAPVSPSVPQLDLEPAPVVARPTPGVALGGGGGSCAGDTAQYRFERHESGISVPGYYTLAFSNPHRDHTHSWCGETSIRADARFNDFGRRNYFGRFPNETGQVIINLDRPTNFTGKTLTVHFFVEGPSDARFSAELFVVHRGRWIASQPVEQLGSGRWWTISHRFDVENPSGVQGSSNPTPFPTGGMSEVSDCNRVALAIHSTGNRRVWSGAIYVDDVGWK